MLDEAEGGNGANDTMRKNGFGEVLRHGALLLHADACCRQKPGRDDLPGLAAVAERHLAPFHRHAQLTFGNVVRGIDAVILDEGLQPMRTGDKHMSQRRHLAIDVMQTALGHGEHLIALRHGPLDQLGAIETSAQEAMPQAKEPDMKRWRVAGEASRNHCACKLSRIRKIPIEVRPAELRPALVIGMAMPITT